MALALKPRSLLRDLNIQYFLTIPLGSTEVYQGPLLFGDQS